MKVKIKDETENIKIKCNHREAILINEALKCLRDILVLNPDSDFYNEINKDLFDKDEFENNEEIVNELESMFRKLDKKLLNIFVY